MSFRTGSLKSSWNRRRWRRPRCRHRGQINWQKAGKKTMRETDAVCYEMKFIHKNLAWTKGTLPKGRKRMDVVDIMNFVKKKNRLEGVGGWWRNPLDVDVCSFMVSSLSLNCWQNHLSIGVSIGASSLQLSFVELKGGRLTLQLESHTRFFHVLLLSTAFSALLLIVWWPNVPMDPSYSSILSSSYLISFNLINFISLNHSAINGRVGDLRQLEFYSTIHFPSISIAFNIVPIFCCTKSGFFHQCRFMFHTGHGRCSCCRKNKTLILTLINFLNIWLSAILTFD